MARIRGTRAGETLQDTALDDRIDARAGDDRITLSTGSDTVFGGIGDDVLVFGADAIAEADAADLEAGSDVVLVGANPGQIRLTFTSAEIGNGQARDSDTLANQDGGLAVRFQSEDASGALTGAVSRFDDEGITFVATQPGVTFDVRDLVSGVARGDQFEVVVLGTPGDDTLTAVQADRPYYFNAGQGNDTVLDGNANDFLVGGAGSDTLVAATGNDSFIGGGGDDVIFGGVGTDTAIVNVSTDGADSVNLGADTDVVSVSALAPTNVRLTFTSAEIGNGNALDSNTLVNQDGGLAVRFQAETAGVPGGPLSRYDDEGIVFVANTGVTFDVRDLVTGAARGEAFEVVVLGTSASETLTAVQNARPYYFNAGQGDDTVTDGTANDFLVGGAGNDSLTADIGNDSVLGGGGNDILATGVGSDTAIVNVSTDGADSVNLGADSDVVVVSALAPTNVRLTFTSAEIGNGNALDSNTLANQDGGLAVRFQAEDGSGTPAGALSRYDDEGITFVGGTGVTFDVRDLVTGAARGEAFEVVTLGTDAGEVLTAVQNLRPYYINAGQGNDTVDGGDANDFLVGGAGNDSLSGFLGNDSMLAGDGNDRLRGFLGADRLEGGAGRDVLEGGADADLFVLAPATFATRDIVRDFEAEDQIGISAAAFGNGIAAGEDFSMTGRFAANAQGVATEAFAQFVYDTNDGLLLFDADGTGAGDAVTIATLNGAPTLTAADFTVLA